MEKEKEWGGGSRTSRSQYARIMIITKAKTKKEGEFPSRLGRFPLEGVLPCKNNAGEGGGKLGQGEEKGIHPYLGTPT